MKQVRNFLLVSTAGLIVTLTASAALGQTKRPMTMIDVIEIPNFTDPQLSPDGREVLYVLSRADWNRNRRFAHIFRINIDGTGATQMTSGMSDASAPRWSPDGRRIALVSRRGDAGGPQIYLMSNNGGEALPLTRHESANPVSNAHYPALGDITWSPDGRYLYFCAFDPLTSEEKEKERLQEDVYAFDENFKHRHLWRISVADKLEERITGGNYSVLAYQLSRDGRKIVFHRSPTPLYADPNRSEIWVMDSDGKNALQLTQNSVPESSGCCGAGGGQLSPDNREVLFMAKANEDFDYYYKSSLFLVPATGGRARMLLPDLPYEVHQAHWSKGGEGIFFLANMGVRSELFYLDLATGSARQLTDGKHTIRGWSPSFSANRHVVTIDSPTNAGDVWVLPLKAEGPAAQVTHVFDYLAEKFELPRQEAIQWKGVDGVTVEGLLYYPLGYQEGKKYPLVVQSHGGMANSDQYGFGRWSDNIQGFTARGYVVLKTNYRGSGGYGNDFQRDMIGKYFRNSHLDVMAGADHLITVGIADPDRMVKMGWSAGGFMTNKIITFTNRFKAASSGAGMVNWISFYGQSDVNYFRRNWLGGSPWQKNAPIDNMWEQSPLSYIANVTTPTLVLVGEEDVRVPPEQSVELYRALKENGVPTRLYMAPREPHGWGELRHQLFKMNVELDWFERHAMGRSHTWEKAPSAEAEEKGRTTTTPP